MAEEQVRPLAPAADRPSSDDEEAATLVKALRRRRRYMKYCCAVIAVLILLIAAVIVTLIFTVFRVKNPRIKLNSLDFGGLGLLNGVPVGVGGNLSIAADISVRNPNAGSFKFRNTTTTLFYRNTEVGEARGPPGTARARRTVRMNMTIEIIPERLLRIPNLSSDLSSGLLTVSTYTRVRGRVNILNVFKRQVTVKMNCTITANITRLAIEEQKCKRNVDF